MVFKVIGVNSSAVALEFAGIKGLKGKLKPLFVFK
jgi:hypothetical protein